MKHFLLKSLKVCFLIYFYYSSELCVVILSCDFLESPRLFFSMKLFLSMACFLKALLFSWVIIGLIYIKDKVILLCLSNNSFLRIMMSLSLPAWLRAIYLEHLSCPFSDLTAYILLDTNSKTNINMKEKSLPC